MDKRQARAFEALAAESAAELLRIATLLTSDPHIAEDVYQETLQRLAARWSRALSGTGGFYVRGPGAAGAGTPMGLG